MDIMHGLKTYDVMLMDMLARLKKQFILVFTKADRANQQEISAGENICTKILEKYQ